jgi:hypothetical protein
MSVRYENGTQTTIQLLQGDIRDAPESFVVIGREPRLKSHYERRTGSSFKGIKAWGGVFPVEFAQASDRSLAVFRTPIRPSGSSRRRIKEIDRLQSSLEYPLAQKILACHATEIAMVPISCRAPKVVASGMVRIVWDISVAAFLHVSGPFKHIKPTRFTIYCDGNLQPFIDVLDSGHYASLRHGWLFNTAVGCDRAKRARYFARRKFKYRRVDG